VAVAHRGFRLADLDLGAELPDKESYQTEIARLQVRMLEIQQSYFRQRRRAILAFEGWDASGKGGAIQRLVAKLDPRGVHVWPIGAPTPEERGRHYLERFWRRLPDPGRIAIFDRTWYGRVLVERVEGLAEKPAWKRAYDEINDFERMLVDDGVRIVKLFLHVSPEEQLRRFEDRLRSPVKRWKLMPDDFRNHRLRADYEKAANQMFERTSTKAVPWHVVAGERKWFARVAVARVVTDALAEGVDLAPPMLDPALAAAAEEALGRKALRRIEQSAPDPQPRKKKARQRSAAK
jgi:polyphosphate kinase 2 (PPK2 family)